MSIDETRYKYFLNKLIKPFPLLTMICGSVPAISEVNQDGKSIHLFFGGKNIFQLLCAGYSFKIYVPFTYNFDFVSKNEFLPLPKEFDLTTDHVFKSLR